MSIIGDTFITYGTDGSVEVDGESFNEVHTCTWEFTGLDLKGDSIYECEPCGARVGIEDLVRHGEEAPDREDVMSHV